MICRPMFLVIEENQNCEAEERVFSESGEKREIDAVLVNSPHGNPVWCDVTGVNSGGQFEPAKATRVEDSSDGTAWLVYGGEWGLRFRPQELEQDWSLKSVSQWGAPFKVLDESALKFK